MSRGYGQVREDSLNKVDTLSVTDFVRVVKDSASRNIRLDKLIEIINGLLSNTLRIVTVTTNYLSSTTNDVILADVTAGTIIVTLPEASVATGKVIQVKKMDNSTNDVQIASASGLIDGDVSVILDGSGGAMPASSFISDGTNWYILNA